MSGVRSLLLRILAALDAVVCDDSRALTTYTRACDMIKAYNFQSTMRKYYAAVGEFAREHAFS